MLFEQASKRLPDILSQSVLPGDAIEFCVNAKINDLPVAGKFVKKHDGIVFYSYPFLINSNRETIEQNKFNELWWLDEQPGEQVISSFLDSTHSAISVLRTMLNVLGLNLGVESADRLLSSIEKRIESGPPFADTRPHMIKEIFTVCQRVPSRSKYGVLTSIMAELGELSEEVGIREGHSYKKPGKDGILGEAIDVILSAFDMIYLEKKDITEEEIMAIMREKLKKWERKSVSGLAAAMFK